MRSIFLDMLPHSNSKIECIQKWDPIFRGKNKMDIDFNKRHLCCFNQK